MLAARIGACTPSYSPGFSPSHCAAGSWDAGCTVLITANRDCARKPPPEAPGQRSWGRLRREVLVAAARPRRADAEAASVAGRKMGRQRPAARRCDDAESPLFILYTRSTGRPKECCTPTALPRVRLPDAPAIFDSHPTDVYCWRDVGGDGSQLHNLRSFRTGDTVMFESLRPIRSGRTGDGGRSRLTIFYPPRDPRHPAAGDQW